MPRPPAPARRRRRGGLAGLPSFDQALRNAAVHVNVGVGAAVRLAGMQDAVQSVVQLPPGALLDCCLLLDGPEPRSPDQRAAPQPLSMPFAAATISQLAPGGLKDQVPAPGPGERPQPGREWYAAARLIKALLDRGRTAQVEILLGEPSLGRLLATTPLGPWLAGRFQILAASAPEYHVFSGAAKWLASLARTAGDSPALLAAAPPAAEHLGRRRRRLQGRGGARRGGRAAGAAGAALDALPVHTSSPACAIESVGGGVDFVRAARARFGRLPGATHFSDVDEALDFAREEFYGTGVGRDQTYVAFALNVVNGNLNQLGDPASAPKVVLLAGPSGAGKSSALQRLHRALWEGWSPGGANPVPLYVSMRAGAGSGGGAAPLREALEALNLSEERAREAQARYNFVLLVDCFDEGRLRENLWDALVRPWGLCAVVACRTEYLASLGPDYRALFAPQGTQTRLLAELHLRPLDRAQAARLLAVVEARLAAAAAAAPIQRHDSIDSSSSQLLGEPRPPPPPRAPPPNPNAGVPILQRIQRIPGLECLARNPLLLVMAATALPTIEQAYSGPAPRGPIGPYEVHMYYVEDRIRTKLLGGAADEAGAGGSLPGGPGPAGRPAPRPRRRRCCGRRRTISPPPSSPDSASASAAGPPPSPATPPSPPPARRGRPRPPLVPAARHRAGVGLCLGGGGGGGGGGRGGGAAGAGPRAHGRLALRRLPHTGLLDFFLADFALRSLASRHKGSGRPRRALALLARLDCAADAGAIRLLADRAREDTALQRVLLDALVSSRSVRGGGGGDDDDLVLALKRRGQPAAAPSGGPGAALASVLAAAGVPLSNCDLSGARLAGADLSGAIMEGTLLRGADLSRACLAAACLQRRTCGRPSWRGPSSASASPSPSRGPLPPPRPRPRRPVMALACADGSVTVADAATGRTVRSLVVCPPPTSTASPAGAPVVTSVAISADGRAVAAGGGRWRRWRAPDVPVHALRLSDDGAALLSGSYDNTVRLSHVAGPHAGRSAVFGREDLGGEAWVSGVDASRDMGVLVSAAGDERRALVWDPASPPPRRPRRLPAGFHEAPVGGAGVSPDGRFAITVAGTAPGPSGTCASPPKKEASRGSPRPDSRPPARPAPAGPLGRIPARQPRRLARPWAPAPARPAPLPGPGGPDAEEADPAMERAAATRRAWAVSWRGGLILVADGESVVLFDLNSGAADGRLFFAALAADPGDAPAPPRAAAPAAAPAARRQVPAGRTVLVGSWAGGGAGLERLRAACGAAAEKRQLLCIGDEGELRLISLASGRTARALRPPPRWRGADGGGPAGLGARGGVRAVCWSADESSVAAAYDSGGIVLYDVESGRPSAWCSRPCRRPRSASRARRPLPRGLRRPDPLTGASLTVHDVGSSSGRPVSGPGADGAPLAPVLAIAACPPLPGQPRWCPPNALPVAAACGDGTVELVDARTSGRLRTLSAHGAAAACVAFAPDGRFLASGGLDATVCVWSLAND
eukprot:tig00001388_g8589.t1